MSGIFILRGMQLKLSNLQFSIGEDGEVKSNVEFSLNYDACAAWARIALKHRENALLAREERITAWQGTDENLKGATLESEFEASIQAIVASASSIDALYAQISDRFPQEPTVQAAWKKNRTARSTQVRETLRTTLGIGPKSTEFLTQYLSALYRIRDAGLHPSGKHQAPIFHPELGISTEWRFWTFRADVADHLTCILAKLLWDMAHFIGKKPIVKSQFMTDFRRMVEDLLPEGVPHPVNDQSTFWLP